VQIRLDEQKVIRIAQNIFKDFSKKNEYTTIDYNYL